MSLALKRKKPSERSVEIYYAILADETLAAQEQEPPGGLTACAPAEKDRMMKNRMMREASQ
jgi:hypothetical protein